MDRDINDIIDDCITALSDGNIESGADQLYELALCFARAGLPIQTFYDIRRYVINGATDRTDEHFMKEKLIVMERRNRDRRNKTQKSRKITAGNTRSH